MTALSYDEALAKLYQTPLNQFVPERKRLAKALEAAEDKAAARRLAAARRPPVSAWAVNQLWRRSRGTFEALLAAAQRLKVGDHAATRAHREALAQLRTDAVALLTEGGHAATEGNLRRITTTLTGLAARGGFAPDPPGALSADREPPGFDALELALAGGAPEPKPSAGSEDQPAEAGAASSGEHTLVEAERQARERVERERAERERAERERVEREALKQRLGDSLAAARRELARGEDQLAELRAELARAEEHRDRMAADIARLESELAGIDGS